MGSECNYKRYDLTRLQAIDGSCLIIKNAQNGGLSSVDCFTQTVETPAQNCATPLFFCFVETHGPFPFPVLSAHCVQWPVATRRIKTPTITFRHFAIS